MRDAVRKFVELLQEGKAWEIEAEANANVGAEIEWHNENVQ
jgi:hypothetical protein